jgi:hypothetical protein
MFENFHSFYAQLISKLSEAELDKIMPVSTGQIPRALAPFLCIEQWTNWSEHSEPFAVGLLWLRGLYGRSTESVVAEIFASLSDEQKAFVQRGYQIMHEGRFPPLTDGTMYDSGGFFVGDKVLDHPDEFPYIVREAVDEDWEKIKSEFIEDMLLRNQGEASDFKFMPKLH